MRGNDQNSGHFALQSRSWLIFGHFRAFPCFGFHNIVFAIACKVTDCWSKWEPKKFLPLRFTFFSTSVTTARTLLRILAYFFFANRQFFLKFSKIYKKINFGPFFMHISLYGGNRGNTLKIASEHHLYG